MSLERRLDALEARDLEITDTLLPKLPTNTLDWMDKARPTIGGKPRNFDLFPFWVDIYEDNHPNIMIVNGRQCIQKDEYVYKEDGVTQVKDLKEGDNILGGTVSQLHMFEDEIYEIRFWNGTKLKVNSEHPFYTKQEWTKAKHLASDDFVMFSSGELLAGSHSVGSAFARLMGYLHSDGHYSKGHSVSFANTNKSFTQEVVDLALECLPQLNPIIKQRPGQHEGHKETYWTWLVTHRGSNQNPLIDFIRDNGLMKESFGFLCGLPQTELREFICGYFNGDGYLWTNKRPNRGGYRTEVGFAVGIHKRRAIELQFMLWRLGIDSIVKEGYFKKSTRPFYRVVISRYVSLCKILPLLDSSKYPDKFSKALLHLTCKHTPGHAEYHNNYQFIKVRSVKKIGRDKVVGFAVSPTHEIYSYLGMRTHNTFKTTFCSDVMACYPTSHPNTESTYVADNEAHLSAFSMQRLRRDTFLANPVLKSFLPHGRANIGTINLVNGSVIYLVTDESEYSKVEGKSNAILMLDEAQYQDVAFLAKALYSLSQTRGRIYTLGIGGEAGSPYHAMWNRTDQRVWVYKDKYWREKLHFDNRGNVTNDNLSEVLDGRWVSQKPENTQYRGYHMPQTIFPTIPLTIDDAILKYHVQPELSIEHQSKNFPKSIYESHCLGEFYKAERRPITPEMVYACMHPYRYLSLLKDYEVRSLKETFKNELRIVMGVDFGSGPAASSTVITILLHWRKSGRYQIAHIESRPQEHQLDQSRYISELGKDYGVDHGVGDLGYGQIQVKLIQDGGTDSRGHSFGGLGRKRFQGCRTIGDETKPQEKYKVETDEHGTQLGRYQIDKTTSIQAFIDRIGTRIPHPRLGDDSYSRPILMIPFANEYETDWLVKDFCSITRKDLSKDPDVALEEDPRQRARKEFNHAKDSVMSIIYAFVADSNFQENAFSVRGIGK